ARIRSIEGASALLPRKRNGTLVSDAILARAAAQFASPPSLISKPGLAPAHTTQYFPSSIPLCRRIERPSSSAFSGGSIRAGLRGTDQPRIAEASKRFFSDSGR